MRNTQNLHADRCWSVAHFLPWQDRQGVTLFESDEVSSLTSELGRNTPELRAIPPELSAIPPELPSLYLEWSQLSDVSRDELKVIAQVVSERTRVSPELLRGTILKLCQGRYLGRRVLAHLLNRNFDDLLKRTLSPLVEEGLLKTAFPSSSDPRQAYTTSRETE